MKESEPGKAAATLLNSLGSIDGVRWLTHAPLVALLYRLAERSGMSWWKSRWARTEKRLQADGLDQETIENIAQSAGRDDPAVAPSGEGRDLPFEEFRKALGGKAKAADKWVQWAERRHLLVRGTKIACPHCQSTSWLPMASLPPPVGCAGCGRQIEQPYGPRSLAFTYRIGEPLRRVLETDSLGHLFTLYWFTRLFGQGNLVGAHPGVEFARADANGAIGEADVLLLFADGSLVPVEVKRRVAGTDDRTIGLMDVLADALNAPYDVLAVTQPARDCPELQQRCRELPVRPRLLLTTDQLYHDRVFWALGANPFAWDPLDQDADRQREARFIDALAVYGPEDSQDGVSAALLDQGID